jgi:hypothetical protein
LPHGKTRENNTLHFRSMLRGNCAFWFWVVCKISVRKKTTVELHSKANAQTNRSIFGRCKFSLSKFVASLCINWHLTLLQFNKFQHKISNDKKIHNFQKTPQQPHNNKLRKYGVSIHWPKKEKEQQLVEELARRKDAPSIITRFLSFNQHKWIELSQFGAEKTECWVIIFGAIVERICQIYSGV